MCVNVFVRREKQRGRTGRLQNYTAACFEKVLTKHLLAQCRQSVKIKKICGKKNTLALPHGVLACSAICCPFPPQDTGTVWDTIALQQFNKLVPVI